MARFVVHQSRSVWIKYSWKYAFVRANILKFAIFPSSSSSSLTLVVEKKNKQKNELIQDE